MVWTLQDAKNKFSAVVERARTEGPQRVTKNGKEAVVIVSSQEWARMRGSEQSLADFFRDSPLPGSTLELSRDQTPIRPVEL